MRREPEAPVGPPQRALGPTVLGPVLIGVGALFLVDRLAWALGLRSVLWALLFGLGAALFLVLYARDRGRWWALYPGFGLAALAAAVVAGNVGGGLLLGIAGAVCVVLALRGGGGRWLFLAGGALVSLGLMSLLEGAFPRLDNGWVLFAGLAATVFVLYRRSTDAPAWGLYIAVALAALALVALFTVSLIETLIAVALVASGTAMVWLGRPPAAASAPPAPPEARPAAPPAPTPPPTNAPAAPPEAASGAAENVEGGVSRPRWARLVRGRR